MTEAHPGFDWTDRYSLGYTSMDDTHREFVTLVDALLTAPDAGLAQALDAFAAHAVAHFEQEDGWMRGTDFPAADCHIDEHAKVLASVREVQQELAAGNAVLGARAGTGADGLVPRPCRLHGFGARAVDGQALARRRAAGVPPRFCQGLSRCGVAL